MRESYGHETKSWTRSQELDAAHIVAGTCSLDMVSSACITDDSSLKTHQVPRAPSLGSPLSTAGKEIGVKLARARHMQRVCSALYQ